MPNPSTNDSQSSLLSSSPIEAPASDNGHNENELDHGRTVSAAVSFGLSWQKTKTPKGKPKDVQERNTQSSLITPPDSASNSIFEQSTLMNSGFATTTRCLESGTTDSSRQTSEWEHRARNAGPAATLARHAAQGREKKKTQFLDRIRRRRDDSRTEMYGDQVLRMDFVRERRQWEDEMNRRAMLEAGVALAGEDDYLDADMHDKPAGREDDSAEAEMSPTEDHDVDDALLEYYADAVQDQQVRNSERGNDDYLIDGEDDDEEYDRLFREMIAQNQDGTSAQERTQPAQIQMQIEQQQQIDSGQHHQQTREQHESSMDLS